MDNVDARGKVPSPPLWLVHGDGRRRLRHEAGSLRTTIGPRTLVDQFVGRLALDRINTVEVVAPYRGGGSRAGTALMGAAVGMVVAAGMPAGTIYVTAFTAMVFSFACFIVFGSTAPNMLLARLATDDGARHYVAYRREDQDDVRALLGRATWRDEARGLQESPVSAVEARQVERMRIGVVLVASAIAIAVLTNARWDMTTDPSAAETPALILKTVAWIVVIGVNVAAWGRMAGLGAGWRRGVGTAESARPYRPASDRTTPSN